MENLKLSNPAQDQRKMKGQMTEAGELTHQLSQNILI
jgi:hypothetical protein